MVHINPARPIVLPEGGHGGLYRVNDWCILIYRYADCEVLWLIIDNEHL